MSAEERYRKILAILEQQDFVSTADLIRTLDTSRETVRRDLNTLAKRGALIKTHGGATSKNSAQGLLDTPVMIRESRNTREKEEICSFIADEIDDDDNIFIDNSSTAANLVRFIPKESHITLITYSVRLLYKIANLYPVKWNVIALGGVYDIKSLSTNDYLALENLRNFKPTKAFLSCHGIDEDLDVTDSYLTDVEIKRAVLKNAQETYLLADHTKLGRSSVMIIANISEFSHVVLDSGADTGFVTKLRERGSHVIIPENNKKAE